MRKQLKKIGHEYEDLQHCRLTCYLHMVTTIGSIHLTLLQIQGELPRFNGNDRTVTHFEGLLYRF